jgi:hypothetical protein
VALLRQGLHDQSDKTFDDFLPAALAPKMTRPMLIIHDLKDRMTRHADSAVMAEISDLVTLHSVKELGHIGLLADHGCMQTVVRFIQTKA